MNGLIYAETILKMFETFLLVAQRYRSVIETARSEGRDISDQELANLKTERDQALASLYQKAKS